MNNLYRTGQSSVFSIVGSGTVDYFPALTPFNPLVTIQQPSSLISASQINKYFDAAYLMEKTLINEVGGNVGSTWPQNPNIVTGSNLQVSYNLINVSITSNTTTVTGSVPAQFGTDPFHDPGFSMSHTFYYDTVLPTNLTGVWNNLSNPQFGPYNQLLSQPQFFVSICPTGGRNYLATILNVPFHSSSPSFGTTSFTDTTLSSYSPYSIITNSGNPFIIEPTNERVECFSLRSSYSPMNGIMTPTNLIIAQFNLVL